MSRYILITVFFCFFHAIVIVVGLVQGEDVSMASLKVSVWIGVLFILFSIEDMKDENSSK